MEEWKVYPELSNYEVSSLGKVNVCGSCSKF